MKKLRQYHLYLGCIFAPALILFAVSGTWQLWGKHHSLKDGSYRPPKVVSILSQIHTSQRIGGTNDADAIPLKIFMFAAACGLVITTVLGIIMAFRFSRSKVPVVLCLTTGVAVPILLLLVYR